MTEYQKKLANEIDEVYIIDCLSEKERTDWKITSELEEFIKPLAPYRIFNCKTSKEVFDNLEIIDTEINTEHKSILLQIVSHGNEECIGLKETMDLIKWDKLEAPLSKINKSMNGNLILNLSSCIGLAAIHIVKPNENETPFFGLVGPKESVGYDEAIKANKVFYDKLADQLTIQEIVEQMNKEVGKELFYCITAEGYKKISNLLNKT